MKKETLIKALRVYAQPNFDPDRNLATIKENGNNIHIPIQEACELAANTLDQIKLEELKFRVLVEGLKRHRLENVYERIMGEKIP